jgi:uncharacterized damage-inducible protein DinB
MKMRSIEYEDGTMVSGQKQTETARIAEQLRLMYHGRSWLGPSIRELIRDFDNESSRRRPVNGTHSAIELVLHITAWLRIARERLSAVQIRDRVGSEDWPSPGTWEEAVSSLEHEIRALEQAILSFPEERLDEPAPATEPQTFYVLLHGVLQHTAYHAGQIAWLRK